MTDTTTTPVTTTTMTDLAAIRTPKTGKMLKDFEVPKKFLTEQESLVAMILRSESMNDGERQYWFNLSEVMNAEQIEKLRDILTRERQKLDEIEKKYGPIKPVLTPAEIAARNAEIEKGRLQKQEELRAREAAAEKSEDDESVLAGFDDL